MSSKVSSRSAPEAWSLSRRGLGRHCHCLGPMLPRLSSGVDTLGLGRGAKVKNKGATLSRSRPSTGQRRARQHHGEESVLLLRLHRGMPHLCVPHVMAHARRSPRLGRDGGPTSPHIRGPPRFHVGVERPSPVRRPARGRLTFRVCAQRARTRSCRRPAWAPTVRARAEARAGRPGFCRVPPRLPPTWAEPPRPSGELVVCVCVWVWVSWGPTCAQSRLPEFPSACRWVILVASGRFGANRLSGTIAVGCGLSEPQRAFGQ